MCTRYFALIVCLVSAHSGNLLAQSLPPNEHFGGVNNEAYLAWVNDDLGFDYPANAFVVSSADPSKGAALHWRIDGEYLELAIAVQATGWMGFGLTVNGGMTGADMVLIESQDLSVAKDTYSQDERLPIEDDCQDWKLVEDAKVNDGYMFSKLRRKLDTGDSQDHAIRNDSDLTVPVSRVIAAWGDSEIASYHGRNNARGALRWYSDTSSLDSDVFESLMNDQADGDFFIGAKNYTIATVDTEYAYFCFSSQNLIELGVNMENGSTIIGFDAMIDNTKHVHHFILQASFIDIDNTANCSRESAMGELVYPWAPGDPAFTLPENVGFKLGGEDGYKSFILEVHYDNMDLDTDQKDSSGVEVYYSTTAREFTGGFIQIGDPLVALIDQRIEVGVTDFQFDCPGDCSGLVINEPVTVLREYLHMHKTGYSTYIEQVRDGEVIRRGRVEYYDFDQTGNPAVLENRYEIQPGDSFTMRCYFNNDMDGRVFGLGSSNEMCIAFLLYYPRKYIPAFSRELPWMCGVGLSNFGIEECDAAVTSRVLTYDEAPERSFGSSNGTCDDDSSQDPASHGVATTYDYALGISVISLVLGLIL